MMALIYRISFVYVYVGMTAVLPSSATSLRRGDGGRAEESDQNVGSSLWPFDSNSDIKSGITFARTETSCPIVPEEATTQQHFSHLLTSAFAYLQKTYSSALSPSRFFQLIQTNPPSPRATFDNGHCQSSDQFGGNDCHYNWGENFAVNYDGQLGDQELNEDIYIQVSLNIDSVIKHSQTCPICGDDPCVISVANRKWSIDLPACPIAPSMLVGEWKKKLPHGNPVPGFLNGFGGTVIEGTVWLKKRNADDGEVLMEVKGKVHLK